MACDPNQQITQQDLELFKANINAENEHVNSPDNTFQKPGGGTGITQQGIENAAAQQRADIQQLANQAISAVDGVDIGVWTSGVTTYNNYNEYATFDRSGTIERWYLRPSIPLGYTATTADPINETNFVYPAGLVTEQGVINEVNAGDSQLSGGSIWPLSSQESAQVGQIIGGTVNFLNRLSPQAKYRTSQPVTGEITAINFDDGTATIGGVTVSLVADLGKIESLEAAKTLSLPASARIQTDSYYNGWSVDTTQGKVGGGTYYVKTLANHRTDINDPSYAPDELIDHTLPNGNILTLKHDGEIYVDQAGARIDTDDNSFSDALQAIMDYSGNPSKTINPTTIKAKATCNKFIAKKAVWLANLDGFQMDFPGRYNCTIEIGTSYTVTQPPGFPDDGYDFNQPSFIMIARRRVTGRGDPWIIPNDSGAGAAWSYQFKGFYFDASAYLGGASLDLIYAPELAQSKISNVTCFKARSILRTIDTLGAYSNIFEDIDFAYGDEAFVINRGTTNLFNRVVLIDCIKGWTVKTNYTTYNSCGADAIGIGQYAWDIGGVGVSVNGCGCEYPFGGVWRSIVENSTITVNGGFFLGGTQRTSPNNTGQTVIGDFGVTDMVLISNGANVTFNQALIRTAAQPPSPSTSTFRFNASVRNGAKATYSGNAEEGSFEYLQRYEWVKGADAGSGKKSKIDFTDNKAAFKTKSTLDFTITGAGTNVDLPFLTASTSYDDGYTFFDTVHGLQVSGSDVTSYTAPTEGVYRIGLNARFENVAPGDYIFIQAGSQSTTIFLISDSDNVADVSYTEPFTLSAGENVRVRYRKNTELAVMKAEAAFFGEMF